MDAASSRLDQKLEVKELSRATLVNDDVSLQDYDVDVGESKPARVELPTTKKRSKLIIRKR